LIIKRIIKAKIILTRLPVGHTHEDIDAVFALIWLRLRNEFCLTPQQYKTLIEQAVSKKTSFQEVKDIFAIPNYKAWFKPFIDSKFGRFAKVINILLIFVMFHKLKFILN
jgi:hypothetical protein